MLLLRRQCVGRLEAAALENFQQVGGSLQASGSNKRAPRPIQTGPAALGPHCVICFEF
jgi:hypothetical protein